MATYRSIQAPMTHAFPASTLTLTNDGITITIARSVWTPRWWNALIALLLSWDAQGLASILVT